MIATDEEALAELFTTAIVGMTPRKQYKGAEGWKPYSREVSGPSRTRRFRLVLRGPRLYTGPGGTAAGNVFEHECTLAVRTDYAGDHSKTQFIIADDFMQLRDVLSNLRAENNGVLLVEPVEYRERFDFGASSDITQIDHIFRVRYMRSIRP